MYLVANLNYNQMLGLLLVSFVSAVIKEITILGTNDAHGKLMSEQRNLPNGETFKLGGLSLLSSYIKVLRN